MHRLMSARRSWIPAVAVVCLWRVAAGAAEEVTVVSAVGMRQVLLELAPLFERETGHRLTLRFDSGAIIVKRIEAGEAADVVLVPHEAARRLVAAGRALSGSVTELASARVGVAVRAGAPRPDISSPGAFRQALLSAKSVARPDPAMGGSSGLHIQRVLERLGISDALASKTLLSSRPEREDEMPAARLARGEAEIALHQIQELRSVPGVVVVGPLPGELDGRFLFSAVVVGGTPRAQASRDLIAFLTTPRAKAVMKRVGMEPAGP